MSKKLSTDTVKGCLVFDERPSTPPDIQKYRRSKNLEPGRRFQHPGLAGDYAQMNLDDKIYGITDAGSKHGAADLINHDRPTEIQRINAIKSEKIYKHTKREPLGRIPDRNYVLPSKFTEGNQAFGIKSASSLEPAKNLIFPADVDPVDGSELYKRSHGSYDPGEQRRRNYDWNIDPENTRFGRKGDTIALNGVSKNIAMVLDTHTFSDKGPVVDKKKVEDFRNMSDQLGQSKNLGQDSAKRPVDLVYGKSSGVKGWSAAETIKGAYGDREQRPDHDLGKSITPGFRNITFQDRAYGCPSIRSDIPALEPSRRSLADSQNYGDDVPAQDLINPPAFSDLAIGPLALNEKHPRSKILDLFARIGYNLGEELSNSLFDSVADAMDRASINDFRDCLNEFILANGLKK